jgi:hypothetical protein
MPTTVTGVRSPRRRSAGTLLVLAVAASVVGQASCASRFPSGTLPTSLSDEEFWRMSTGFSEPAGTFDSSDNLVSNETHIGQTVGRLRSEGGVYVGVGPEQNFSYVARLRPAMAFIVDIRRENRNLHLMYKALFELSADRADFVSRLFSRERPAGVGPQTDVQELFDEYQTARPAEELYQTNVRLIRERLLDIHRLPLSPDDLTWIGETLHTFYSNGPDIHYRRPNVNGSRDPSYRILMTARDLGGNYRSYLATEDSFLFVKDLQTRNVMVPVVGDFGGPSALRRTGDYIRQHAARVSAFYGSNVEVYLTRRQMAAFCGSLAALPYDSRTSFIGSKGLQSFLSKLKACPMAAPSN